MNYFVSETSIVRTIWGKADTVLFIFGGAAAEFALNKAVDWLYFTGKLPQDPIGRLFSTVLYAHEIIFQEEEKAVAAIESIAKIHKNVEAARGATIPDWAYRDVLYMLIHYSIAAFELLERKLSAAEKEELFSVFLRVGKVMGLTALPATYTQWLQSRTEHLDNDLIYSRFTADLFEKYRASLGRYRYAILLQVQKLLVPRQVYTLLQFSPTRYFSAILYCYKPVKHFGMVKAVKYCLLPKQYRAMLRGLERI